jgi:hypothetical protein
MKRQFILFLFSTSFLMSCGQTKRLSEEDYKWMPYKGNETLVFRSNTGDIDTIFLLKKDTLIAYAEPQAVNGIKYEVVSIFCKHSDPYMPGGKHRYLKNKFFKVEKAEDNRTEINILLSAKDADFYRLSPIKTDSLSKENPSTLQTQYGQYDDVYIINAEDYLGSFSQWSNFITKVYWSKSNGLIRYDKKDTVYWELAKKW